uniref:Uncharacterized protein n=1 Tax=Arundo donax TaxID=35708 RepID=A0A0A9A945_ARUDO
MNHLPPLARNNHNQYTT